MADTPTALDLFSAGRREALISPTPFDPAIIDVDGSDVNIVFNVAATMGEEVAQYLQTALNELSLSTARGDALDRWVFDRYQLVRKEAQSAVVTLELTRSNSSPVTVPAGSIFGTDGGQTFSTLTSVVFASGNTGPLSVSAVAQQAGRQGNVAAETVVRVLSSLADDSVQVTNPDPAAGGKARETDEELRSRARNFFVTARRGTRSAIEFGAQQVARVAQASATEALDPGTGLPGYRVFLNISDPEGQANLALADEVERSLLEFRALGVPVSVIPAVPQYEDIVVGGLQFEPLANTTEVLQQARNALLAAVNGLPPGTTLRRNLIERTLGTVAQLIVPEGAIVEPAGDVVPSTGTVIRTREDLITLNGS